MLFKATVDQFSTKQCAKQFDSALKEYIKKNYQHYSKKYGIQGISRQLGLEYEVVHEYVKSTL